MPFPICVNNSKTGPSEIRHRFNFNNGSYFQVEQRLLERFEHEFVSGFGQVVHQRSGTGEHSDHFGPVSHHVVHGASHHVREHHGHQHPLTGLVAKSGHRQQPQTPDLHRKHKTRTVGFKSIFLIPSTVKNAEAMRENQSGSSSCCSRVLRANCIGNFFF